MVRTSCIKEVDSHWLSRYKEIGSYHSHPENKKKLLKLKVNNSSNTCQRIKVTRQPPKLERERQANTENYNLPEQNRPAEPPMETVIDQPLKAPCEQFWELNWIPKKEVKKKKKVLIKKKQSW